MTETDATMLDRSSEDLVGSAVAAPHAPATEPLPVPPLARPPLRILIVSWYFPPFNTMGALRSGKLARFLLDRGHDVRVVCSADVEADTTLAAAFPDERVVRTRHVDVNGLPKAAQRLRVRLAGGAPVPGEASAAAGGTGLAGGRSGSLRRLRHVYQRLVCFPDPQVGWLPYGIAGGRRLTRDWRPELVFATAPPFTTLYIGRRLARLNGVPWVAEYRDRWTEDPYGDKSAMRLCLERLFENRLIRGPAGLITVSEPWAKAYRRRVDVPVTVVSNGFDPEDFPPECSIRETDPNVLRIVYTGILYGDKRDPSPLFAAIARLGADAERVRVEFYGAKAERLRAFARRHRVERHITTHEGVPYRESVRIQREADVLLLMQWNNPREQGNVPGKLFEYIGARRPVLALGLEDGVPAKLLAERGAGCVINDPDRIAEQLKAWLEEKRRLGRIPPVPIEARRGLSRNEQYVVLETALYDAVAGSTA